MDLLATGWITERTALLEKCWEIKPCSGELAQAYSPDGADIKLNHCFAIGVESLARWIKQEGLSEALQMRDIFSISMYSPSYGR